MAESLSKAKLTVFRKLHHKKIRELENQFVIEGWHLLEEAMKAGANLRVVVFDGSRQLSANDQNILEKAKVLSEAVFQATDSQLKALGETKTNAGVVSIIDRLSNDWESVEERLEGSDYGFIVALDGLNDPGNCGSIIRGCDWFGVSAVVMGEGCPDRENGKLVRATMGGLFYLPVISVKRLVDRLEELQADDFRIIAGVLGASNSLQQFVWPAKSVLVIGNEARGVSEEVITLADYQLEIPRFGEGESLNAAMATSVFLSHWRIE